MNLRSRTLPPLALFLLCLCCLNPHTASAASPDHWVGTWATAPVALADPANKFGSADTTLREIVHVSIGGPAVRVILTNEFGLDSLTIGAANIALSAGGSNINPDASGALTFSGRPSITIPPGALAVSDPVNLKLPPTSDVAVSIFIPAQAIRQVTHHSFADQTSYTASGNVVGAKSLDTPADITSWPFLKGIDVTADAKKGASIVTFGDSITDGTHSTRNANARWPDVLAQRLQADKKTANLGVLNEGIGGNRVLHDGYGPSALARFDRDVLAQAGVKYLIIMESINDIGRAQGPRPSEVVSANDLIAGLSQLATRAHTHGIKVIGATLTPYLGAGYSSPAGEIMREAVNQWIRTTNQLDGVIDFDKVTSDPAHPNTFLPADDSGDHLHPNDAGYKVMGDAIDLKIFK